jgi:hypothetical protein
MLAAQGVDFDTLKTPNSPIAHVSERPFTLARCVCVHEIFEFLEVNLVIADTDHRPDQLDLLRRESHAWWWWLGSMCGE